MDGDAKGMKCDTGNTFHLQNRNLDELIFSITMKLLSNEEYARELMEKEKDNPDSKLKACLAMYLFKKYKAQDKKWIHLGSFYHYVAMNYENLLLQNDSGLDQMISSCTHGPIH